MNRIALLLGRLEIPRQADDDFKAIEENNHITFLGLAM
jgi:hypothetical protein